MNKCFNCNKILSKSDQDYFIANMWENGIRGVALDTETDICINCSRVREAHCSYTNSFNSNYE